MRKEKINSDSVSVVKFSTDNKYVATASLDGSINIFGSGEYKHLRTISGICNEINV